MTQTNRQEKKLLRETDRQRRERWNDTYKHIDKQTRKKLHRETDRQRRERWNDT